MCVTSAYLTRSSQKHLAAADIYIFALKQRMASLHPRTSLCLAAPALLPNRTLMPQPLGRDQAMVSAYFAAGQIIVKKAPAAGPVRSDLAHQRRLHIIA